MSISHRQPVVIPDPKNDNPPVPVQNAVIYSIPNPAQAYTLQASVLNNGTGGFTGIAPLTKYYNKPGMLYRYTMSFELSNVTFESPTIHEMQSFHSKT